MKQCTSCGSEIEGSDHFCPSCGAPVGTAETQKESGEGKSSQPRITSVFRRVGLILVPLVVIGGSIVFYSYVKPSVHAVIKRQPVVAAPMDYDSNVITMTNVSFHQNGNDIVFSLSDLKQYRLIRFEYPARNIIRPVMAYIDPEGRAVTAISISDHCGSTEFQLKNNQIYCAHCPSHWDMMTMEAYACCGTYYPDPIPSRVVGDEVRIPKEVVEKWSGRL
ncbi:MAG TPA: hypothetical protein DGH68_04745 [Bacteroidetes bacterium]|nr:hypothetical protein [Bacteroidota bacterium]